MASESGIGQTQPHFVDRTDEVIVDLVGKVGLGVVGARRGSAKVR